MGKGGKLQTSLGGIGAFFLIFGLLGLAWGNAPIPINQRADAIHIDLAAEPSSSLLQSAARKQMPGVDFFHDRHTQALEGDNCRTCHLTQEDRLIFLFKRLDSSDPEVDREIYHTSCIGCHNDRASAGTSSGPLRGNCRGCHSRGPKTASSWVPLIFGPSIHSRHESAELIPPDPGTETNCGTCHHQYDAAIQKTAYIKGEENACQYCHPAQASVGGQLTRPNRFGIFKPALLPVSSESPEPAVLEDPPDQSIRFMSAAAHDACVACHRQLTVTHNRTTGPLNCAGCHTAEAQAKIRILETVPRMKRNQPDATLMAAWLDRDDLTPQSILTEINPVPFDHMAHEGHASQSTSCRHCHHSSLNACSDCHTRGGAARGGWIDLNQAMHGLESQRTCIGCHRGPTTARADCAGCHTSRPQPGFQDQNCRICHGVDRTTLPTPPLVKTAKTDLAAQAVSTRKSARKALGTLPPLDQIPDRVRIDALLETYEAVDLPHRKIIQELDRRIQTSGLAQTFHSDPLTMCAGCHHHSPADLKPPKCASCHSPQQAGPGDGRPALIAAYHNQCMGCHRQMGIEKPQATACNECHPTREKQ